MPWLLTDEELHELYAEVGQLESFDIYVAQAQLRKVVEEGDKPCPHINYYIPRHSCDKCWKQLKKESGTASARQ